MSHLSTALTDALRELQWKQSDLSEASGVTHSQINRACRGLISIGGDTLHAIAKAIPQELRGTIAAAWLKDQLKPELLDKVDIFTRSAILKEQASRQDLPAELDDETRDLILWLARQAIRHTAVRDALRSFQKAVGIGIGDDSTERARSQESDRFNPKDRSGSKAAKGEPAERVQRAAKGMADLASRNPATLEMMEEHLRLTRKKPQ